MTETVDQAEKRAAQRRRMYVSGHLPELFKERERIRAELHAAVPQLKTETDKLAVKNLRNRISYMRQRLPLLAAEVKALVDERKTLLETIRASRKPAS